MSVNEKISKGDLELYCLDVLSQDEKNLVEKNLQQAEYDSEKEEIEKAITFFATQNGVEANPSLKESILSKIIETPVKPIKKETSLISYPMAAAITIAVLTSIMSIFYWYKWQNTENQLAALNQEKYQMAESIQLVNQELSNAQASIVVLTDTQFKTVVMNGVYAETSYSSTVHWNPNSQETYLNIGNLNPLPAHQQYQLWSIQDGQPVDAGVVNFQTKKDLIKMKNSTLGQAFAITIEPTGGSQNPTIERLIVMGTI